MFTILNRISGKKPSWHFFLNRVVVITTLLLVLPLLSYGAGTPIPCKDTFPNLVNDICWKCIYPLKLGGYTIMNLGDMDDNVGDANSDFEPSSPVCTCTNPDTGLPDIGTYISYWEPLSAIELIQKPGCFSFMFGMDLSSSMNFYGANGQTATSTGSVNKSFYNAHYYAAPLMAVMDLLYGTDYCNNWYSDIDLMYFTEADPSWNDDELSIYVSPEAVVFANPIAQAIGAVDCLAASAGYPLNSLFWTAGCWGSMYPFTGNSGVTGSPVRSTSLLAARLLAKLTRVPIPPAVEMDTSSSAAKCEPQLSSVVMKSQYRMSTLYPIAESSGKCCHPIGRSTLMWGEFRHIPGTGEHQTYLISKKKNCCLKLAEF